MNRLPTLDLYNEAVQNARVAFNDPQLQRGQLKTNGLGLPSALGGGFAITYQFLVDNRAYAVRVFHKDSHGLDANYRLISSEFQKAPSPYFVEFEYQHKGIKVHGRDYPLVKMEWVSGDTLGAFLEANYSNKTKITNLQSELRELSQHLEERGIAHGDVQNGNIIINNGKLFLIDYDGVFVPGMTQGGGREIGHRHFQHPARDERHFGPKADRFSFIAVDLMLSAIINKPTLFSKYATTGENILFTGNDYLAPHSSAAISDVCSIDSLRDQSAWFKAVCQAEFEKIPTLADFLEGRNIPSTYGVGEGKVATTTSTYAGALPVVHASDFTTAARHIGDRVELIGQIRGVKRGRTRYGKDYVFLNFGDWRENIVKITIWSEGLEKLAVKPGQDWVGKWVSATGLMDPPYINPRYGYEHLGVTIQESLQLHIISSAEAKYRLGNATSVPVSTMTNSHNQDILDKLRPNRPHSTRSRNQQILDKIRSESPKSKRDHSPKNTASGNQSSDSYGCLFAIIISFLLWIWVCSNQ